MTGNAVHVKYTEGRIVLEYGPAASAKHVSYHKQTIAELSRYQGVLGMVRQLTLRLKQMLGLGADPQFGTKGFEARLEVKKLKGILEDLESMKGEIEARLLQFDNTESTSIKDSEAQRNAIQSDIDSITKQLLEHSKNIDSKEAGVGYIAAGDTLSNPYKSDDAEFYKSLEIGQTRYYQDESGNVGSARRASDDVVIIETNLESGSMARGDYQTKAQPGGVSGSNLPNGKDGFEILHATGPLVGYESPQGIFFGPHHINHKIQKDIIENYIRHFRDNKAPGVTLKLTVVVERYTTSATHPGVEFLRGISYQIEASGPGVDTKVVFDASVKLEEPDNPHTDYDFRDPYVAEDITSYLTAGSTRRRNQRRVQDMDRAAATAYLDTVYAFIRELKSVPATDPNYQSAQAYAKMLREQLNAELGGRRATQNNRLTEGYKEAMDDTIADIRAQVFPTF